jgi:hypothetical protein
MGADSKKARPLCSGVSERSNKKFGANFLNYKAKRLHAEPTVRTAWNFKSE